MAATMGHTPDWEQVTDAADIAFGVAKRQLEISTNRIAHHREWPIIRQSGIMALIKMLNDGEFDRRRNPEPAWTGTDRQVAWAKTIRADAAPTVRRWAAEYRTMDDRYRLSRARGTWSSRAMGDPQYGLSAKLMEQALETNDARFWIDVRDCPDSMTFLAAVERLFGLQPVRRVGYQFKGR
jgi:hypothetical protein